MIRMTVTVITAWALVLVLCWSNSSGHPTQSTSIAPADSLDSLLNASRERNTVPTRRTDRTIDSLTKPVRIMVKNKVGCDTSGYVPWPHWNREQIGPLVQNGFIIVRDSVIELVDTLCFKWYVRVAKSPTDRPRIWLEDTCTGSTACEPAIADEDKVFNSLCDSVLVVGRQSWVNVFWRQDPFYPSSNYSTLSVEVDTMWIPIVFQIYTAQDNTGTPFSPQDSTNKWLSPITYFHTGRVYPLGARALIKRIAWVSNLSSTPLYGNTDLLSDTIEVSNDQGILIRWITNDSTRMSNADPTKISIYTQDIVNGGTAYLPVWKRKFEIDDNQTHTTGAAKGASILLTVTLWLFYVSHL